MQDLIIGIIKQDHKDGGYFITPRRILQTIKSLRSRQEGEVRISEKDIDEILKDLVEASIVTRCNKGAIKHPLGVRYNPDNTIEKLKGLGEDDTHPLISGETIFSHTRVDWPSLSK